MEGRRRRETKVGAARRGIHLERLYPLEPGRAGPAAGVDPTAIYDGIVWGDPPPGRPYVAVNMVTTVDGKVTLDHNRYREPIGSRIDRDLMVRLRDGVDAVMRGAATVRAYPYYPHPSPGAGARRRREGLAEHPLAVVVSASCTLPLESGFFQGAPRRPLVLTGSGADRDRIAAVQAVADVAVVPADDAEGGIDWAAALALLRSRYGVRRLLLEGGPRVNYAFFRRGLVDELFWTVAPKIAGQADDRTMVEGPRLLLPLPRLALQSVYVHHNELFLRYRVLGAPEGPAQERSVP